MHPKIVLQPRLAKKGHQALFIRSVEKIPAGYFTIPECTYITSQTIQNKQERIFFNRLDHWIIIQFIPDEKDPSIRLEKCRKAGDHLREFLQDNRISEITIVDVEGMADETLAFSEGLAMGSYRFLKYKTKDKPDYTFTRLGIFSNALQKVQIQHLRAMLNGLTFARDLVNEPNSYLTAPVFAREIENRITGTGIHAEIFTRKKLESLQMGGILGVNQGSTEPPVMMVLEWKPANAENSSPIILVGKGIVYDTGGINLKAGDHMNYMKNDMAGGAAVAGAIFAIAESRLPLHVVGLIPATDNRPGEHAIVSGDILRMHNGLTVEVVNTDAEGRLILADALSYAQKYHPGLVITLATLTGSAIRAIGKSAIAGMEWNAKHQMKKLKDCGLHVYERIVEFPLWDDYAESLKSDIADLKNLGDSEAGQIIAGKFLQRFTDYPFIHLDIAGPAFTEKRDSYRGTGATGAGIRLLFEFFIEQSRNTGQ